MDVVQALLYTALAVAAAALISMAILRWRKLRLDEVRRRDRHASSLSAPPPSPYEISRGVRLIDPDDVPTVREAPARPRLDPERQYVFADTAPLDPGSPLPRSRHNNSWALERSSHRSRLTPGSGRVLIVVVIGLAILFGVGTYIQHSGKPTSTTTSTTTTVAKTTTTVPNSTSTVPLHH